MQRLEEEGEEEEEEEEEEEPLRRWCLPLLPHTKG